MDSTTGSIQRILYKPYGELRSGAALNGRAFLNQVNDNQSGLNYLNNRFEDPTTGLFLSVDPLVAKTGQPYDYTSCNPIAFSDPSGLSIDIAGLVKKMIAGIVGIDLPDPKQQKGENTSTEDLSDVPLFGRSGMPSMTDVNQGGLGDCWLMAVLSSVASSDPSFIKSLVTDNGDGTYTVHFADSDVTVDGDFYKSNRAEVDSSNGALWPLVVEKAYAVRRGGYGSLDGDYDENAIKTLGYRSHTIDLEDDPSSSSVAATMGKALGMGKPVTADSDGHLGYGENHSWSVQSIDCVNGVIMVTVTNPWGHLDGQGLTRNWLNEHGIRTVAAPEGQPARSFQIPIDQFMDRFGQVVYGS